MAVQISGNDITVPRDTTVTRNLTVGGVLTYEDVTNVDSVGLVTARSGIEIGARPGVAASISIDGNMVVSGISTFNSRVLLGTTTEGEANADDLTIAGSGHVGITIRAGTTSQSAIYMSDATSGGGEYVGNIIYDHSDNHMRFATAETERLRIDSSGRLLLGTTTEGAADADNLTIADSGSCGITVRSGTSAAGGLYFSDATSGAAESDGAVLYNHSSKFMAFYANESERLRIHNDGELEINTTTYDALTIITTENGTNGPQVQLTHISASPAASDYIGQFRFSGKDSAGNTDLYGRISCVIDDPTSGQETGHLDFSTRGYASFNPILRLKNRGSASAPSYTSDDINGIILDVYNTGNPYPRYMNFIAKAGGDTDSNIGFWTEEVGGSPTEKLRIAADGEVFIGEGFGNTNRSTLLSISGSYQNPTGVWTQIGVYSSDSYAQDKGGTIGFGGQDGSVAKQQFAAIKGAKVNGTSGNYAGYMAFYTRPDGDVTAERMRLDEAGRIGMGVNPSYGRVESSPIGFNPFGNTWLSGASYVANGGYGGGYSLKDGSKGYSLSCYDNGADFYIFPHSSTTAAGSGGVYINDAATSWSSASDERDKENLVNITDAITKVKTLRTVIGNYIWKPEVKTPFLIAQDVQAVLPEAVTIRNKGQEEERLGMSYQNVIPLVTAALKEAIAEIETLKTEVAALKSS